MASVWIIEQGDYSSHHVVGVYATKELAETHVERLNRGREYDLAYCNEWPVRNEEPVLRDSWHTDYEGNAYNTPVFKYEDEPAPKWETKEQALKIAAERRAKFEAQRQETVRLYEVVRDRSSITPDEMARLNVEILNAERGFGPTKEEA